VTPRLGLIHHPRLASRRIGALLGDLAVPRACDWISRIQLDGGALGNDLHANCVPCGALRSIQIMRAVAAGDARQPTTLQALALYRDWTDWDGTDATDIGTASDYAATRWAKDGVGWGEQWEDVPAIVPMDPTNVAHFKAAIAHLGPVQLDLNMPQAWEQSPTTWTIVSGSWGQPGSWGPHRVCAAGYDQMCLYVVTWGKRMGVTWPAVAQYALGAEAVLSRSWLDDAGRSPSGLELADLTRELRAVAA